MTSPWPKLRILIYTASWHSNSPRIRRKDIAPGANTENRCSKGAKRPKHHPRYTSLKRSNRTQSLPVSTIDPGPKRCQNNPGMEPASRDLRTRVLYDLAREFAAQLELDQLVPLITSKCREVLDAEGVAILLLDRERGDLYFPYYSQRDPKVGAKLAAQRVPADRSFAGSVLRSGRAERVDDLAGDPRHYTGVDRSTGVT